MKKFFFFLIFIGIFENSYADLKDKIILNLKKTDNLSFDFIQTINDKSEEGNCVIEYQKKIFCLYDNNLKKILVSNGKALVIKNQTNNQYYFYPLKKTPLDLILDKNFLINQIQKLEGRMINDRYYNFSMKKNNNNINIFFSKKNFNIVGWQIEDVYQNLSITYIFNTSVNTNIDNKIFKLPANH